MLHPGNKVSFHPSSKTILTSTLSPHHPPKFHTPSSTSQLQSYPPKKIIQSIPPNYSQQYPPKLITFLPLSSLTSFFPPNFLLSLLLKIPSLLTSSSTLHTSHLPPSPPPPSISLHYHPSLISPSLTSQFNPHLLTHPTKTLTHLIPIFFSSPLTTITFLSNLTNQH